MPVDNEVYENNNTIISCECNVLNDITFIYYINNTIIKFEPAHLIITNIIRVKCYNINCLSFNTDYI